MTTEEIFYRQWQELTISNNFLFGKTMEMYPDLCRRLIERILNIKIRKIEYLEREKVIEERTDCKGVRLDVYVADESERVFNLEMQVTREDDLAKRIRYYQSLLDLNDLKRGNKYAALRESYIIFICLFDYFGRGREVYTFKEICEEDLNLRLGDGTTKIFLNTEGILKDASKSLKNFLEYVAHGTIADDFIAELDAAVREIKSGEKVRLEYMTLELYIQERAEKAIKEARTAAFAEGREEGREEERFDLVKNLLKVKTPIEYIVAATGWSKEKIAQIIKESPKN